MSFSTFQPRFAHPYIIFFLVLPAGISQGFATVTLPYLLTHSGFSVAAAAGIVAIGFSANLWRFLWGPVADLTLSLKRWFWIGIGASSVTLLILGFTPLKVEGIGWLTVIVFLSQVASTFIMLPVGGIMANRIAPGSKGRAGGWFQAGLLGGTGLGGGAGLWLATHYSAAIACIILSAASVCFGAMVMRIDDVRIVKGRRITKELTSMGKDILSMLRTPVVLFVILMICMPIGSGAAANVWSAIAADWKTDANTVALVTGVISGLVGTVGCIAGGYLTDRWGNWVGYLGFGSICGLVAITMALFPLQPVVYISGVLAYAFSVGLINATFSSVLLFAIGNKNASTKYSLLSSLGNLPIVYMTAFDGWAHDKHDSRYMLIAEGVVCLLFVLICVIVLRVMKAKNLIDPTNPADRLTQSSPAPSASAGPFLPS